MLDGVIDYKFVGDTANADILKTRHREAYMYVQTETGGAVLGKMRAGGMQGDSMMPEQFGEGYNDGVETWVEQTRGDSWRQSRRRVPASTRASVCMQRICGAQGSQAQVEAWDESVDAQLHLRDMGQNRGKKEHMVKFVGKGATKEMQRAYREDISFAGSMRQTLRYLGACLNNDGKGRWRRWKRRRIGTCVD